ncbi:hypothetical protein MPDQ_004296 [Monascus purpureus]|uniref:Cytokinesis regulator n=1 Tax=Monascus purpureus TaxID=5098 RepID=A0A507QHI5_MONPU|nr:hypothetical protein MPDQ_004296 [Monascus purpureus]
MEALTVQLRRVEETIECWDDDGDLQCTDDVQFCTASTVTSVTNSSIRRSGHRDSISSRRSTRSDLDSIPGDDDDWQVLLHETDEFAAEDAILSARNAGIPIPENVPKSALTGGTIKRLGRKKRADFVDDWSEDVLFPGPEQALQLKIPQEKTFPDSLRHIYSTGTSPVKTSASPFWESNPSVHLNSSLATLDKFRDEEYSSQDVPTIKIANYRLLQKEAPSSNCLAQVARDDIECFDDDFDLPAGDIPLRLGSHKGTRETSTPVTDDFDFEFSEDSTGARFGGTAKDRRSNPSSSVSVLGPSVSSCIAGESEEDCLDGLIIPEEPLDLQASLKKRQDAKSAHVSEDLPARQEPSEKDDFFTGLEIGDVDIYGPEQLAVNPNVKCKTEHPNSPTRRSGTTVTFTNAAVSPKTRIPRLSSHDRTRSTQLETVSESGAPISRFQRPLSRFGGHSAQSSISGLSALSASSATSSAQQNRRFIGTRTMVDALTGESAPLSTEPLTPRRSVPSIRDENKITSTPLQRPLSRQSGASRSVSSTRPRTPVDRSANDARLGRRQLTPFIPAGASANKLHHVNVKPYQHSRRTNSDSSIDNPSPQGALPRPSRISRGGNLGNKTNETSPETLVRAAKRSLTKPTRRRNFGDGTELESFDDLPTSSSAERRFVKTPSGRGVPRSFRSRLSRGQHVSAPMEASTQPIMPSTTSSSLDYTPRFARDTNASRNAREQRIASMNIGSKNREANPLAPLSSNWKAQYSSRQSINSASARTKRGKATTLSGNRPHLIKPLGSGVHEAKGMRYNPITYQWEGNESSISEFDFSIPRSPKAAPALITNVGTMQNVQVVGEMVFDPQRMCWLKLAPLQPGDNGLAVVQDEDDVFAGLDDLEEKNLRPGYTGGPVADVLNECSHPASGDDRSGDDSSDEWPITEEFDVGPEFVKRQRAEEEKWRRKVHKWVSSDRSGFGDGWRWAIRDLVRLNAPIGAQPWE